MFIHKGCDFNDDCREFIQSCLNKFFGLQQVTDCMFVSNIFFINVYKGQTKSKDRHTYKFAWFEEFKVVAEVAFFVGNPVVSTCNISFVAFEHMLNLLRYLKMYMLKNRKYIVLYNGWSQILVRFKYSIPHVPRL